LKRCTVNVSTVNNSLPSKVDAMVRKSHTSEAEIRYNREVEWAGLLITNILAILVNHKRFPINEIGLDQ